MGETPRHIWPEHSKLPRSELFHTYLKDTPLQRLSRLRVPFSVPRELLAEHTAIFAPAGHGKTQLLQALVHDLLADNPPAMIIMDSHGDMLRNLRPIIPPEKLVVLDPEVSPPALNLFDLEGTASDEMFGYLFTAIDRTLTAKQLTAVIFALRLLKKLPTPTLVTFLEVLGDRAKNIEGSKYRSIIEAFDPITHGFFATQYFDKDNSGTRTQVANRLFSVLGNPIFEKMFNAPTNSFDAFKCMQEGKIVLVNTSMLALRTQGSSVLGRYVIAQCLSAAYKRATLLEHQRRPALIIIDEAAQYFDDTTETILSESRKYNVGLMFATQYVGQLPDEVRQSMAGNTATKIVGPVSMQDARYLAHEMGTSPEFIRSMKKTERHAEFAAYVRNRINTALRVEVPFGVVPTQKEDRSTGIAELVPEVARSARSFDIRGNTPADYDAMSDDFDPAQPTAWKDGDEV